MTPIPIYEDFLELIFSSVVPFGGHFRGSDWSRENPDEHHQNFARFLTAQPQFPRGRRNSVTVVLDEDFGEITTSLAGITSDIIEACFDLPTTTAMIAFNSSNTMLFRGSQLRTKQALDRLASYFKSDTFSVIILTPGYLCPLDGCNFVLDEACAPLGAIVSTARYSLSPNLGAPNSLRRLFKILSHESAHLLGLPHCCRWQCNMNGKNSLHEVDSHPLQLCPDCLLKVCYSTNQEPSNHANSMRKLCSRFGLDREELLYAALCDKTLRKNLIPGFCSQS